MNGMNKYGFNIIELMIAILISSMMALTLFQLISQTRKGVSRISSVIEVDQGFISFYNQLEKDVMGMFAPESSLRFYQEKDEEREKEKKQSEREARQQQGQPSADKLNRPSQEAGEKRGKKARKHIENVFSLDAGGERFFLSFITTGGLQLLESDGTPQLQPFMRRVAYLLEKDPQRPSVYRLMYRTSSEKLDLTIIKAADFYPSYELISGISNFEIELTVFEQKKEEAEKGAPGSAKKGSSKEAGSATERPQPSALKEWDEASIWERYKTLIPAFVRLKGTTVDRSGREYPFEFMIRVIAYNPVPPKEKSAFEAIEDIAQKIFGAPRGGQR